MFYTFHFWKMNFGLLTLITGTMRRMIRKSEGSDQNQFRRVSWFQALPSFIPWASFSVSLWAAWKASWVALGTPSRPPAAWLSWRSHKRSAQCPRQTPWSPAASGELERGCCPAQLCILCQLARLREASSALLLYCADSRPRGCRMEWSRTATRRRCTQRREREPPCVGFVEWPCERRWPWSRARQKGGQPVRAVSVERLCLGLCRSLGSIPMPTMDTNTHK